MKLKTLAALIFLSVSFLSSCKHASQEGMSSLQSTGGVRSAELRSEVLKSLRAIHPRTEGSLWDDSRGELADNFVVQSPEGYWGKRLAEMPKGLECKAGSPGCDKVFPRKLCSTDNDCASSRSSCQLLEASASPVMKARKMCLGSGDSLLDRFYSVIVSAENHLEITSLSMPNGSFRSMLANALAVLHERPNPPTVRILLSGEEVLTLNAISRAQPALEKLWAEIGAAAGKSAEFEAAKKSNDIKMRMNLAYLSFGPSWNHSKIVLADEARLIQGGHNLWADAYNNDTPVSDLSMETSGPIAKSTQAFVNSLWSRVATEGTAGNWNFAYGELPNRGRVSKANYAIENPNLQGSDSGNIPMIALGRMGNQGDNPSNDALKTLVGSSKSNLKFVVQDLYGVIENFDIIVKKLLGLEVNIAKDPTWLFEPIAKSVLRGVSVKVIQSDTKVGPNDYTLLPFQETYSALVKEIEKYAGKNFKTPNGLPLRHYICSLVEYAPYRYAEGEMSWDNKSPGFASHAKMVIVDDSAFYIGSHNFYNANLQEFGIAVFDESATERLAEKNWNLLWQAAKSSKATCPLN